MKFAVPWGTWGKRLLVLPPIVLAVLTYGWLVKHPPPLSTHEEQEVSRSLETISVPRLNVRPVVSGFGTAKYSRSWRAVTQVQGRIKKIHKDLRPGATILAGNVLLEIDDSDYRSRVKELDASIDQQNAEIEQFEQSVVNDNKKITVEKEMLKTLETEFQRQKKMVAEQAEAESTVDEMKRQYLAQVEALQNLRNSIALVAPQIKGMQAAIRQSELQKETALRDIGRTKILAPFDMRVGNVQLEIGQFVSVGEKLFIGYDGSQVEIEVQLPLQDIHRLLVSQVGEEESRKKLNPATFNDMFQFEALAKVAGVEPYHGKFLRVREVVDSQTKMVGFVVGVKNSTPSEQESPQPPLLEGTFCDVDIYGDSIPDQVAIPRRAIRNGSVYVVDDKSRLAIRKIKVAFTQQDYAVVTSGLEAGEQLVIANPSPAIIGMLVDPIPAQEEAEQLIASIEKQDELLKSGTRQSVAETSDDQTQ